MAVWPDVPAWGSRTTPQATSRAPRQDRHDAELGRARYQIMLLHPPRNTDGIQRTRRRWPLTQELPRNNGLHVAHTVWHALNLEPLLSSVRCKAADRGKKGRR